MLDLFQISRNYHKLRVVLTVDCVRKDASLMVTYDRLIKDVSHPIAFHDVTTPEAAERYIARTLNEQGSMLEILESRYRRLDAARAA